MRNTKIIATHQVGKDPWGVAVDLLTGYAYVANSGEKCVTVFHDGDPVTKIELPLGKSYRPWQIAIDPHSHCVYVGNRSSKIKHSENSLNRLECDAPWVHVLQ